MTIYDLNKEQMREFKRHFIAKVIESQELERDWIGLVLADDIPDDLMYWLFHDYTIPVDIFTC